MKYSKISTKRQKFCSNDKDEIVNIVYDGAGITHFALSRLTGSDTYRMLNRMAKSGVVKERITTLFSQKKSSVFFVDNLNIAITKKIDLISWAPFYFRKINVLVGKITIHKDGIRFPVFDSDENKFYAELEAIYLNKETKKSNNKNIVYVTDNRQKFLEYVDENSLPKSALFIVLFKEGDSQFLTAYHSFSSTVEKLNSSEFFKFLNVKPIFDPEFYRGVKSMYYSKKIGSKGENECLF